MKIRLGKLSGCCSYIFPCHIITGLPVKDLDQVTKAELWWVFGKTRNTVSINYFYLSDIITTSVSMLITSFCIWAKNHVHLPLFSDSTMAKVMGHIWFCASHAQGAKRVQTYLPVKWVPSTHIILLGWALQLQIQCPNTQKILRNDPSDSQTKHVCVPRSPLVSWTI